MTPSATQDNQSMRDNLVRIAPGLYVDDTGVEYFYLTGIYPSISMYVAINKDLLENFWPE